MTRVSLLHVTDLHYESPLTAYADDNKSKAPDTVRESYMNAFLSLTEGFSSKQFDAIALTGDFTTQGKPKGFDLFEKESFPTLRRLVSSKASICMVPGNHDVVWNLDPVAPDYFDQKFKRYKDAVTRVGATSSYVPTGALQGESSEKIKFTDDLRGPLFFDKDKGLAILCINSSLRCGEVNKDMRTEFARPLSGAAAQIEIASQSAMGGPAGEALLGEMKKQLSELNPVINKYSIFDIPHVTQTQLHRLKIAIKKKKERYGKIWDDCIKVAALHHHLVPFDFQATEHKAFELMADSSKVLDFLASQGFYVVLTGHKHQPYSQRVESCGRQILVLGGMTVAGGAVTGFQPGIRSIELEQSEGILQVCVAELFCRESTKDVKEPVELARLQPQRISLVANGMARSKNPFPKAIEAATDHQLYNRPFYKKNAVFKVSVQAQQKNRLEFTTTMSYEVLNRTSSPEDWLAEYNYDRDTGSILSAKIDKKTKDPQSTDFETGRGFCIRHQVPAYGTTHISIRSRELFDDHGSSFYTSYHPATDFKFELINRVTDVEFDLEILYFSDNIAKVRTKTGWKVFLEHGLLPYQGVKMTWKVKERKNGN